MPSADALFDTFPIPASLRTRLAREGGTVAFPRSMRIDEATGLVAIDPHGHAVILDGDAAFAQWVSLTVRNQRDAHYVVPRWYGVHKQRILARATPDEQRMTFEREVRATLLPPVDARCARVTFDWQPQQGRLQRCNVTVTSVRGVETVVPLEVPIG